MAEHVRVYSARADASGRNVVAKDIGTIQVALESHVDYVVAALAINATANLREATPVDTGWARANWIPTTGKPRLRPAGSRERVSTDAQQAGLMALVVYRRGQGPVYIVNNVPYIRRLNAGYSPQAPALYVERELAKTIAEVEALVRRAA